MTRNPQGAFGQRMKHFCANWAESSCAHRIAMILSKGLAKPGQLKDVLLWSKQPFATIVTGAFMLWSKHRDCHQSSLGQEPYVSQVV